MNVLLMGPPAAGKGTQCEMIQNQFSSVSISTGALLRNAIKKGTAEGLVASMYMKRGELVPDSVMINMVQSRLQKSDIQDNGWLLDGFPRTKAQAEAMQKAGIVPDAVVVICVPDAVLIERIAGRRYDPVTGKVYHLKFLPPPNDPEVSRRLEQRQDDTVEVMKHRLEVYHSQKNAVLSFYSQGGLVYEIDGNREAAKVFASVRDVLAKVQRKLERKATVEAQRASALIINGKPNTLPSKL